MHLRSVRLRGFKSFPDALALTFEPGVSVVVGPNGSGKSNIADAIVWASGSLSPSQLRAERPDDVLFNGGGSRPAADRCEVELVFDNSEGDGPLPYSELSVTRRLHRGGEGQYLINRTPVRRLDVMETLADAGLGGQMHAIISQGRVDAVLSSRPAGRRALIEEAAGLGSFKQRRHRAELKLARVRNDVDRARDLEAEVKKRLRPLRMQATAAERAEKLAAELARIRVRLDASTLAHIERRAEAIDDRKAAASMARKRIDERLEGVLVERQQAEQELEDAARRHESATAALYRVRSSLERLELRLEAAGELSVATSADADEKERLAALPQDFDPFEELARAERLAEEAASEAREARERASALDAESRLATDRLRSLEGSLAEREGLAPAPRALADEGRQLALATVDVDIGYERAVAAALAWRASALLAGDPGDGVALLERARRDGLGPLSVLLQTSCPRPETSPPTPRAERLSTHARAAATSSVIALLHEVWVVPHEELASISRGLAVTVEGHCFDADRGELWYEGETARSVLLSLEARCRQLRDDIGRLEEDARRAGGEAAELTDQARLVDERRAVARHKAAALPRPVEPREAARVRGLAEAAGTLERLLREAVETARRFEAPLRARVDAGGLRTGELGAQLRQLGEREAEFRREAGEAQHRLSSIGIEGARLEAEREEVVGRLPEETAPAELAADDEEQLRTKLDRGERRREELGQVNPLAAQEYEAERERLDELTAQREDLERSVAELDELCSELTETVERSFEETFASVQEHFCNVAATLFPGGEGRLRLADGEEGSESGVEVELRLAGKRITRLSLLSGGEKALGALSFLFALFLARPCPFYVLDEVEAALDDTNIGRFVELLRRYASEAQFIVVTHQKRTMDAADILYGVTMADDGVSQIVSRRLRPAMEAVPA